MFRPPASEKGVSPLVTAIFLLAITISGIVIVMNIGMPTISKAQENALFTESKQNLKVLRNSIDSVVYGSVGSSRKVNLDVTDGTYLFNNTSNKVAFSYKMGTDFLPVGLCKKTDGIKVKTYGVGRVLDLRFEEGSGNTTEDCSRYENDGNISNASWVETDYGTGLNFTEGDYVEVEVPQDNKTMTFWAKNMGGEWTHYAIVDGTKYVDGEQQNFTNNFYRYKNENTLRIGI